MSRKPEAYVTSANRVSNAAVARSPRVGDDLGAVVAHSLLNSMAIVCGNLHLMTGDAAAGLSDEERRDLMRRTLTHADLVSEVLNDLVRGLPSDVRAVLEA